MAHLADGTVEEPEFRALSGEVFTNTMQDVLPIHCLAMCIILFYLCADLHK